MSSQDPTPKPAETAPQARSLFARYPGVIIKNVIGWLLMLSALVLGSFFPIPIGTPMFIIGFAMISLPGKRRLTSGALRGISINLYTRKARMWRLAGSLLLPPAFVWFLAFQRHPIVHPLQMTLLRLCAIYSVTILGAWVFTWLTLLAINAVVRVLPRVRRSVRPWLRDHGINLLPPRRKPRFQPASQRPDDQNIIEFGGSHPLRWGRREKHSAQRQK
ncbi:MAG: hypothetical protein ABSB42_09515 [Tepidisphaeraceae bacterium]|jgi:hypothetical protein